MKQKNFITGINYMKKHIANIITTLRIFGAVAMLFTAAMSVEFYIIYTFCGVTDVFDGLVARVTKTQSTLGAKLDSVADLTFYSIMVIKVMPVLIKGLPKLFWWFPITVLIIRIFSYIVAAIKYKCFASVHTYANKLTGFGMFCLPYLLNLPNITAVCSAIGVVGMYSSLEELIIHLISPKHDTSNKTVYNAIKKKSAI